MIRLEESFGRELHSQSFWSRHKKLLFSLGVLGTLGSYQAITSAQNGASLIYGAEYQEPSCPKIEAVVPAFEKSVNLILNDDEYKKATIERLSGAIQIPTEIEDVYPSPKEDPDYFKYFYQFHDYLEKTFPLTYQHLKVEKVNEIGLLYTWEGSDSSLKPVIFMAHQDVVPVNRRTWDEWEYPPFSGYYDEETDYIWGRGASDCKNLLTAELEAVEQLIKDGYTPQRTVLVSFGFDEESSGTEGAQQLSQFIEQRYGEDSIHSIVDEGNGVDFIDDHLAMAAPVNAEKGYVDTLITINGHGGHSSVPPDHTTIGVAAQFIKELEAHSFKYQFEPDNPIYQLLTCTAEHSDTISPKLKRTILGASKSHAKKKELGKFLASHRSWRDLIRTTSAVDIITGGIKANALPEVTSFLVNHRIDIHSSVEETLDVDVYYAKKIAKKFGYGVSLNGEYLVPETELGTIEIIARDSLEPAPISPTSGPVWDLFAGTIQNVFENGVFADREDVEFYVATHLSSGNTDTRYYWNLTRYIYRFIASLVDSSTAGTTHSVNERIKADRHISAIAFVYQYIVNTGNVRD
ncbi:hypothetical protein ZYGR_0U01890 [Zygosaccharomyces rouxii]|uniref:ZYRO0F12958p n=2 Tax=Zygosaccharomyces rouxii TaxID=4956 RepID=C5DYH0_ZYGRC|nr:uncharacterized protein ZYRO0F12958g [Zygosaccharomyces rouxii]KAH9199588.1 hypothetical protein LQ764DRAFT_210727 [Zygosaccharomyces rouxii]GAV50333.1 hypothetical protein ZYGR_0U01890 [Zygosaccharomyces rouxii]CAR28831.1 ZYRO0F12958p [Zygosaccharomyces rouxii]